MPLRFSFPDDEYRKAQARIFESKAQQIIDRSTAEDVTPERKPAFPVRSPADVLSGLDTGAASGLESFGQGVGNVVGGAVRNLPLPAQNVLGTAFDLLGRPQQAVYGAAMEGLRQRDTGEDLFTLESLRKQGEAGLRGLSGEGPRYSGSDIIRGYGGTGSRTADILGGFGLDVVADPLNLLPPGTVAKGAGLVARGAGRAASVIPGATNFARGVENLFVPHAAVRRLVGDEGAQVLGDVRIAQRNAQLRARVKMKRELSDIAPEHRQYLDKINESRLAVDEFAEDLDVAAFDATQPMKVYRDATDAEIRQNLDNFLIGDIVSVDEAKALSDRVRAWIAKNIETPEATLGLNPAWLPWYFPRLVDQGDLQKIARHGGRGQLRTDLGGFEEHRTFTYRQEGEAAGYKYADPWEALTVRLGNSLAAQDAAHGIQKLRGLRTVDGQDFMVPVVTGTPLSASGLSMSIPDGYREIHIGAKGKDAERYAVPAEVADEVEGYWHTFVSDEGTRGFWKGYDTYLNFWKKMVTSIHPAFHVRNESGNLFLMWQGGFDFSTLPARAAQAMNVLRDRPGEIALPNGRKMTNAEVLDTAIQHGLIDTGQFAGDLGKADEFLPFRVGRQVGSTMESHAKVMFLIDRLAHGSEVPQAVAQVRKYLFDYSDLTPFEQVTMRRVAPFYAWARKNLSLQLQAMLENPRKAAAVGKGLRTIQELATPEDDRLSQYEAELWPKWAMEQLGIQVGRDEQGTPQLLSGAGLPIEDLNKLYKRTPERTILGLLAELGPPAKLLEYIFDMSSFTGRHISDPSYQNFYRKAYPVIGSVPGLRDWLEFTETKREVRDARTGQLVERTFYSANPQRMYLFLTLPTSRLVTTAGKLSDIKDLNETGRKSLGTTALNLLTGARIASVDVTGPERGFGTDTTAAQQRSNAALEQAAQQFEQTGRGRDYRESRKAVQAEQRGAFDALLTGRAEKEGLDEKQRDVLRRQLLSGPGRVLAEYRAITPESVGGSMQNFFQERERFLGQQTPEMQQLIQQRGLDYIKRLGETAPTAARVEREYQQALDEYKQYRAIFEQFGLDTETVEQATEFERQYRDTSGQLGGSPERALRLARDANPEGYAAYRSYLRVRSGPRGERIKRARQRFRAEHPAFMRFFSESVIEQ